VAQVSDQIIAAGGYPIWVLEYNSSFVGGTAESCYEFMSSKNTDDGVCVGDSDTMPTAFAFYDSPFALGRGIDLIVDRHTMEVVFTSGHGTPSGNENLTGAELVVEVEAAVLAAQAGNSCP